MRALIPSDVVDEYTTRDSFTDDVPVAREVAHDLWNTLQPGRAVILVINESKKRELCGRDAVARDNDRHAVVTRVIHDTGPSGALHLDDGACLRNYHALVAKLERMRERRAQAAAAEISEDVDELDRVIDVLEDRVQTRQGLTSYFYDEYLPKQAIQAGFARSKLAPRTDQEIDADAGLEGMPQ